MEEIIKLAYQSNKNYLLDTIFGKVYNESCLKEVINKTDYLILGRGVISRNNLVSIKKDKTIEILEKTFIPIQTEDEFQAFKERLVLEKKESDQQKQTTTEQWKVKLKEVIEENTPEGTSDEDKEKIFEIVLNCPIKKVELTPYYWKIYDIVGTAEKTRNILMSKDGIKIGKNEFPKKNRYNTPDLTAGTVVRVSIKTAVGVTSGRWVHPGEFRRKPL